MAPVVGAAALSGSALPAPHVLVADYSIRTGAGAAIHGVIAAPRASGKSPLVIIVHTAGRAHAYEYLVEFLASRGFVAVTLEHRGAIARAYDRELLALRRAAAGGPNPFGIPLEGRVDLARVGLVAHSRAAQAAAELAKKRRTRSMLVAAPVGISGAAPLPDVSLSLVLAECDGVAHRAGAAWRWYDAARLSRQRKTTAAAVVVDGANHSFFAGEGWGDDDGQAVVEKAGCDGGARLDRFSQHEWLGEYATAFFRTTLGYRPPTAGLDPARPSPLRLFGVPVTTALAVPERLVLQYPRDRSNVDTDALGGHVRLAGPITAEVCGRGQPCSSGSTGPAARLRLSWSGPASYEVGRGQGSRNLIRFAAVALRARSDVVANARPRFSIVLQDRAGAQATVVARATKPDPGGALGSIRVPLERFGGIDLRQVANVRLAFNGPRGALLVEDLELVPEATVVTGVHVASRAPTLHGRELHETLAIYGTGRPTLMTSIVDQTGVQVASRALGPLRAGRRAVSLGLPRLLSGAYRVRFGWKGVVQSVPVPFRVVSPTDASVVSVVRGAGPRVALTFDDCLYTEAWSRMLATLRRYHAHGTFFCNGQNLPGRERLMRRTVLDGHGVGSHGWSHHDLRRQSDAAVRRETERDAEQWWRATRADPRPFLRPPYGRYDPAVLRAAGASGHRYLVLWDIDTKDWQRPGAAVIVRRALVGIRPGAIVLLHVLPESARALPAILEALRARNLEPVTLNTLLAIPGAAPENGHWPRLASPAQS